MGLDVDSPAWKYLLVSLVVVAVTGGLAIAMQPFSDWPPAQVFLTAAWCQAIQWVVFIHAAAFNTEKFFDLTGSLTYISATVGGLFYAEYRRTSGGHGSLPAARQFIVSGMVLVWALRLGSFLFWRIMSDGKDGRFDDIKPNKARFFNVWVIQGLWVFLTAAPVFCLNSVVDANPPLCASDFIGWAVWLAGFALEAVADHQKTVWRANPANKGRYITVGLWGWSRHPNYLGEITLWFGVFIACSRAFATPGNYTMFTSVISPFFVALLICKLSGIPKLEENADAKWGHEEAYLQYKARTPVLLLRLPRCGTPPALDDTGSAKKQLVAEP